MVRYHYLTTAAPFWAVVCYHSVGRTIRHMSAPMSSPRVRALASAIKEVRLKSGISMRKLASELGLTHAQLSYWESGKRLPPLDQVSAILTATRTTGPDSIKILDLARNAHEPNWVSSDEPGMSTNLAGVLDCERTADHITIWVRDVIPGLLQTEPYTRAIIEAAAALMPDARTAYDHTGNPLTPDEHAAREIDARVRMRMERREILIRPDNPVNFVALIAESAIREVISSPSVQITQLAHVLEMAERPNVTVQCVQSGHGWHPGMAGPFVIYEFSESPPIVYIEHFSSASFLYEARDVEAHELSARVVRGLAMSPAESAELIASVIKELETT